MSRQKCRMLEKEGTVFIPDSAVCAETALLHGPNPAELRACIWTWYWVQGFKPSTVAWLVSPAPSTSTFLSSLGPSIIHTRNRYPTVSGLLLYSDTIRGWREKQSVRGGIKLSEGGTLPFTLVLHTLYAHKIIIHYSSSALQRILYSDYLLPRDYG